MADAKQSFDAAIEHLTQELARLRTGRASADLVDGLMVDAYGTPTPLKHMAQVNVQDAQSIVIQPFDPGSVPAIEKAFQESDLGLNPTVDGHVLRVTLPPMTEERRTELTQVVSSKAEEARVSIRNVREDVMKEIKGDDSLSEDEKKARETDLGKHVDEANEKIQELAKKKEEEVMTV